MAHQAPHVVIVGGGFGGLNAARQLGNQNVRVTLIDRNNYHLFQPLLYQIATGGVSPGDISAPLRVALKKYQNVETRMAEVTDIDPAAKTLTLDGKETVTYDKLVLATGSRNDYFGNDQWCEKAPALKTIESALSIRRLIFEAFEHAEWESDPKKREAWMTFVIVGGGPTGVELAGALGELAHATLYQNFRHIDVCNTRIILLEAMDKILGVYPEALSKKAVKSLERLGVTVQTHSMVTDIQNDHVTIQRNGQTETIPTRTVLWTAGVKASGLGKVLADKAGAEIDRKGRVVVQPDLSLASDPNIFVIGDLAFFEQDGAPLPGVAPVASQQGRYVARRILCEANGKPCEKFVYHHKGNMAVIGRNAAVADFGKVQMSGVLAWLLWLAVHIAFLIGFDNKVKVLAEWAWNYFTKKKGAQLITEPWTQKNLPVREKELSPSMGTK